MKNILYCLVILMIVGVAYQEFTREPEALEPIELCKSYKDESKLLEMSQRLGARPTDLEAVAINTCGGD